MKYCKCGCGKLVSDNCDYFHGSHSLRGKKPWNKGISPSKQTIHKMRNANRPPRPKTSLETKKKISDSLRGRKSWNKGLHLSDSTKDKISKKMIGKPGYWKGKTIPLNVRNKISQNGKGRVPWNKGKRGVYTKESLRLMRLSHYERLKKLFPDGRPSPNIGDKEIEFIKLLTKKCNWDFITSYPVSGYFVDVYFPQCNIAVEFDEVDGHSTPAQLEHDKIRESNIIDEIGCQFIRISEIEWDNNPLDVISDLLSFIEQRLKGD